MLVKIVAIILRTLRHKEVEMGELLFSHADFLQLIDNLNQKLLEFLARNRTNFVKIKTIYQKFGNLRWDWGFGDV